MGGVARNFEGTCVPSLPGQDAADLQSAIVCFSEGVEFIQAFLKFPSLEASQASGTIPSSQNISNFTIIYLISITNCTSKRWFKV